ncbi:hypothetical protein HDU96_003320 [Phlyctochytrium bullatum]|nr:hypothetical protein HDU96_003320 [Phlyctochytrium bullatum]
MPAPPQHKGSVATASVASAAEAPPSFQSAGSSAASVISSGSSSGGQAPSTATAGTGTTTVAPNGKIIHHNPTPADVFDESVYSLLPVEYTPPAKQNMYRSKFAGQARAEYVAGKKDAASMGPAKIEVNKTDGYLKKGDREKKKPHTDTFQPDRSVRKAPVPKEPGVAPAATKKDFIKLNALENINSSAKKPNDSTVDYRHKKDYGTAPSYLVKRQKDIERAKHEQAKQQQEETANMPTKDGLVPLPEDERIRILEGLKANWEKLNSDYQKLSLTVDTVPKIARKVNMEQQLKQLEDHIAKFSHPNILVSFNSAFR